MLSSLEIGYQPTQLRLAKAWVGVDKGCILLGRVIRGPAGKGWTDVGG